MQSTIKHAQEIVSFIYESSAIRTFTSFCINCTRFCLSSGNEAIQSSTDLLEEHINRHGTAPHASFTVIGRKIPEFGVIFAIKFRNIFPIRLNYPRLLKTINRYQFVFTEPK